MSVTGRCRVPHLLVLLTFVFSGERIEAQRAGTRCSAYCLLLSSCWGFYVAEKLSLLGGKQKKAQARYLLLKRHKIDLRDGDSSGIEVMIYLGSLVLLQAQEGQLSYPQQRERHTVYSGYTSSTPCWHGDHFFLPSVGVRLDLLNLLPGWDFPSEPNRARALFIPSPGSYRLVASVVPGMAFGFWLLACADEHSAPNATECTKGSCT